MEEAVLIPFLVVVTQLLYVVPAVPLPNITALSNATDVLCTDAPITDWEFMSPHVALSRHEPTIQPSLEDSMATVGRTACDQTSNWVINKRTAVDIRGRNVTSTIHEPLPPASEKVWRDEVIPRLATTVQLAYGPKTHGGVLGHPRYSVAAAHWDVHYNNDLKEKLKLRAWRFPLTMGNQKSEMRERYPGWPNLPHEPIFHAGPQPFGLAAHHADSASKSIVASTRNKELAGKPFYIRDKAVLRLNEPYISVTARDFWPFTEKERQGYARKDAFSLQQCGTYPLIRDPGPMRDLKDFPQATRVPRLGPNIPAVPFHGLRTLAQESYQPPHDDKRTWDRFCPVERPPTVSCRVPVVEIMCVPRMYETEYKCYGSGKPMPV